MNIRESSGRYTAFKGRSLHSTLKMTLISYKTMIIGGKVRTFAPYKTTQTSYKSI